MDGFEETINMMVQIQEDNTVPKSIRAVITTTVQQLRSCNEDQALQRDRSIQKLDELANNPQTPAHTRMMIWNIVSMLESTQ
ncbi:MAG: UPF0147 family protein [Nanoarchaeota archaeon]